MRKKIVKTSETTRKNDKIRNYSKKLQVYATNRF